jgi:indolepyruvate ferredoxin oxidoreductase beta subunit
MSAAVKQQILISGVGGQGVLFVTRLLAEAAIGKGLPVYTSETHGMAQRGGTVVSHFKTGDFASPLIRPGRADGLIVLKAENLAQHGAFLKAGGWAVVNAENGAALPGPVRPFRIDADALAQKSGQVKSLNLILLGFALAVAETALPPDGRLFCGWAEIDSVVAERFGEKPKQYHAFKTALETGYAAGIKG